MVKLILRPLCTLQNRLFAWAFPVTVEIGPDIHMFYFLGRHASNRMGEFISPLFTLGKKK